MGEEFTELVCHRGDARRSGVCAGEASCGCASVLGPKDSPDNWGPGGRQSCLGAVTLLFSGAAPGTWGCSPLLPEGAATSPESGLRVRAGPRSCSPSRLLRGSSLGNGVWCRTRLLQRVRHSPSPSMCRCAAADPRAPQGQGGDRGGLLTPQTASGPQAESSDGQGPGPGTSQTPPLLRGLGLAGPPGGSCGSSLALSLGCACSGGWPVSLCLA